VLEYAVASSTVAHGWSHYFVAFLGLFDVTLPARWIGNPIDFDPALNAWAWTGAYMNLPAALIVLLVTVVLVVGIRESAGFNAAMVILKVAVSSSSSWSAVGYIDTANWHPFMPFGASGVLTARATSSSRTSGSTPSRRTRREARNPQRDVPIGIVAPSRLHGALHPGRRRLTGSGAPTTRSTSMRRWRVPVADRGMPAAVFLISVGAVVGITSVLLVLLLSQSRVLLAMARDGLIPRSFFAAVHPRFQTPHKATILTASSWRPSPRCSR
jgi:APA family basic amino acid/polyamine antiporter